jgi:hypothetical protein
MIVTMGGPAMTVVLLVACSGVAVGCSARSADQGGASSATSSAAVLTRYGQDTSDIARHIPDCTAVTAVPVAGSSGSGGANHISTCILAGHRIVIYGWPDPAGEDLAAALLDSSPPAWAARGPGWTEISGDSASLDVQKAIALRVAQALGGSASQYR